MIGTQVAFSRDRTRFYPHHIPHNKRERKRERERERNEYEVCVGGCMRNYWGNNLYAKQMYTDTIIIYEWFVVDLIMLAHR